MLIVLPDLLETTVNSTLIEDIGALTNRGKFRAAVELAERNYGNETVSHSAHFYFQWGVAADLSGDDPSIPWCFAEQQADFTTAMKGDIETNYALRALRRGELAQAEARLKRAVAWYKGDINRLALVLAVAARIAYAAGDSKTAYSHHQEADEQWQYMGPMADKQWIRNNSFHRFKAVIATRKDKRELYARIMCDEPRFDRRVRVWSISHFGRIGLRLDAFAERRMF